MDAAARPDASLCSSPPAENKNSPEIDSSALPSRSAVPLERDCFSTSSLPPSSARHPRTHACHATTNTITESRSYRDAQGYPNTLSAACSHCQASQLPSYDKSLGREVRSYARPPHSTGQCLTHGISKDGAATRLVFPPTRILATVPQDWSRTYQGTAIRFAHSATAPESDAQASTLSDEQRTIDEQGPDSEGSSIPPPSDGSDDEGSSFRSDDFSDGDSEARSEPESEAASENTSDSESELEEEHVPLTYQMPVDTLKNALTKSSSNVAAYWSHRLYRGPQDETVVVHYCKTKQQAENVLPLFKNDNVLGFDIEWFPGASATSIKDNVSLIQLANESRIALIQVALFKETTVEDIVPADFKAIMEDDNIMKVGVGILGDCTRVKKHLGVEARGLIELSHLHKLILYSATQPKSVNRVTVALATQIEHHLFLPLAKGEERQSDWHKELKHNQVSYAAADAYAGFRLFDILESKRKKMKSRPPRPAFAELKKPISLGNLKKLGKAKKPIAKEIDSDAYETAEEDLPDEEGTNLLDQASDMEGNITAISQKIDQITLHGSGNEGVSYVTYPELPQAETVATVEGREETPARQASSTALEAAETWVQQYIVNDSEGQPRKVSESHLRTYHLWHYQEMEAAQIASLLRDPPLKPSTVANYVLDAVSWKDLSFDPERVKVLLAMLPDQVAEKRYWSILQRLRV